MIKTYRNLLQKTENRASNNCGPILHRFIDTAGFCAHGPTPIPP